MAPTKDNWENGQRIAGLQKDYHNQRRYSQRQHFDWKANSEVEKRVFRDM